MTNIKIDLNLLKLEKSAIVKIAGKNATKECLIIPIEDNDIYVSVGNNGKRKAAYLSLVAWELREEGKFGDTHIVKQSFSSQFKESHGEEYVNNTPILGNGKPVTTPTKEAVPLPTVDTFQIQDDDLPF